MRLIDADALKGPLELQRASYARIGATECAEAYANCLWEIAQAPTIGGWISVKDRLPKTGTLALVFGSAGAMTVGRYIAADEWLVPGMFSAITHWMPLPEPPKEVTGDE